MSAVSASAGLGLDPGLASLLEGNFHFEHQRGEKFDTENIESFFFGAVKLPEDGSEYSFPWLVEKLPTPDPSDISAPYNIAIKLFKDPFSSTDKMGESVVLEMEPHENLISTYGIIVYDKEEKTYKIFETREELSYELDGDYSLVGCLSEKGPDTDLFEAVRDPSFTFIDSVRVLEHIAEGMGSFQEQGFRHVDLKPGNVLVSDVSKICDFGSSFKEDDREETLEKIEECLFDISLSKGKLEEKPDDAELLGRLEGEEEKLASLERKNVYNDCNQGTIGFLAPEVSLREFHSRRSDVFSFGSIMYFLLNPRALFSSELNVDSYKEALNDFTANLEGQLRKLCDPEDGSVTDITQITLKRCDFNPATRVVVSEEITYADVKSRISEMYGLPDDKLEEMARAYFQLLIDCLNPNIEEEDFKQRINFREILESPLFDLLPDEEEEESLKPSAFAAAEPAISPSPTATREAASMLSSPSVVIDPGYAVATPE
jgi:serine/threonine protein kinase